MCSTINNFYKGFLISYHTWKKYQLWQFNESHINVSVMVSAKVSASCGIGEYLGIGIGGNFGIGAALIIHMLLIWTCSWICLLKIMTKYALHVISRQWGVNMQHYYTVGVPAASVLQVSVCATASAYYIMGLQNSYIHCKICNTKHRIDTCLFLHNSVHQQLQVTQGGHARCQPYSALRNTP